MNRFIILAARRSGTTLFLQCLDSHPEVQCHKKAFDVANRYRYLKADHPQSNFLRFRQSSRQRRIDYLLRRNRLFDEFLSTYYAPVEGINAIGVRLAYEQVEKYPGILQWAIKNEVRVIHLIRENSLKAIVSHFSAKERKIHHSAQKVEQVKITIPPKKLQRRLDRMSKRIKRYRRLLADHPHIEVTYESFVQNRAAESKRVLEFLDVDPTIPLTSELRKLNSDSIEEILANYAAIQSALSGTPYERFLTL